MDIHHTNKYIKCDLKVIQKYKWPGIDKQLGGGGNKTKWLQLPGFNIYDKVINKG